MDEETYRLVRLADATNRVKKLESEVERLRRMLDCALGFGDPALEDDLEEYRRERDTEF